MIDVFPEIDVVEILVAFKYDVDNAEAEALVVLELTTVKLLVVILPVVVMLEVEIDATDIFVVKSDVLS